MHIQDLKFLLLAALTILVIILTSLTALPLTMGLIFPAFARAASSHTPNFYQVLLTSLITNLIVVGSILGTLLVVRYRKSP